MVLLGTVACHLSAAADRAEWAVCAAASQLVQDLVIRCARGRVELLLASVSATATVETLTQLYEAACGHRAPANCRKFVVGVTRTQDAVPRKRRRRNGPEVPDVDAGVEVGVCGGDRGAKGSSRQVDGAGVVDSGAGAGVCHETASCQLTLHCAPVGGTTMPPTHRCLETAGEQQCVQYAMLRERERVRD